MNIATAAMKSPFTVSQWQELEHQALIYKYMDAGLPVPPHLVLPIQNSFHSISPTFFPHPTVGYCSLYGKKVDPEPGRCRRTDGKKWRCSKDAHPDSKYCERHMHRGRNRSRKPVESQTSSSVSESSGSFQNLPVNACSSLQSAASAPNQSCHNLDAVPYGIPTKDYRYPQALRTETGEHGFFSEANKGFQMDPQLDNGVSPFTITKSPDGSALHSFFSAGESSGQPVQLLFNEWPKNRDSWSSLEEDRTNPTLLSISTPVASSELSTPSSRSPHHN